MAVSHSPNFADLDVSQAVSWRSTDDIIAHEGVQKKSTKNPSWADISIDEQISADIITYEASDDDEDNIEFKAWKTESGSKRVQKLLKVDFTALLTESGMRREAILKKPTSREEKEAWIKKIIKFVDMLSEADAAEGSSVKSANASRFVTLAHHASANFAVQALLVALKAAIADEELEEADRTALQERSGKLYEEIKRHAAHLVRNGVSFHVLKRVVDVYPDKLLPLLERFASKPHGIFDTQPGSSVIKHIIENGTDEMRAIIRTTVDSYKPNPNNTAKREKQAKKFLKEIQDALIWGNDMPFDASPYRFHDTQSLDNPFEPFQTSSCHKGSFEKTEPRTPCLPPLNAELELESEQACIAT